MTEGAVPVRPAPAWTDPGESPFIGGDLRELVESENARQLRKWGIQTHSPAEWALILAEEEGELARQILGLQFGGDHYTGTFDLQAEAIQVATLALKIAKMAERSR